MNSLMNKKLAEMREQDKVALLRALSAGDIGVAAAPRAAAGLGIPTNEFMSRPIRVDGRRPFQWAPVARGAALELGGNATADLSHVVDGTDAVILAQPGARIVAGGGRTFLGTVGQMATAGSKLALRVMRIGQELILQQMTQGDLEYGPAAKVTHDLRFVCGGQSNMSLMEERGGWGGFSAALARGLRGSRNLSVDFVNGATGGTPLDRRSAGPSSGPHWWDAATGKPGPALDFFMEQLAIAAADGQDIPMRCFWTQGESDANALQNRRLTTPEFIDTILAVWDHIWARYPEMDFIVNMIGGYEYLVAECGTNAARVGYLRAIEQREKAHHGIEMYDLPRDWWDIHYQYGGYAIAGARMAAHLLNLDHGADNELGPRVTGAKLQEDGKSVILSIDWGRTQPCAPPQVMLQESRPYGIYFLPPGGNPADLPIDAVGARFLGRDLMVRSKQELAGCSVGGPYGCCTDARRGHVLHDMSFNNFSGDRGLPLRSFLVDIT
ncbi:hypothetical protein [Mangrovicoccus sp. HB161399]|uniref:hypothetical protein n=1 Tax=Mangrovicoccus sp. HB161399 TaxID=2720392 RepID=UPI00155632A0|nr:hypothetical protein [Mangrovicoccus sp. HB161399]